MTSQERKIRLNRKLVLRLSAYMLIALVAFLSIWRVTETMGYESKTFQSVLFISYLVVMVLLFVLAWRRLK